MANMKSSIPEMSDSEFLSFLYSERDRENSISEYHGWNNWALAGSIITVACFAYATVFNASSVDWLKVLYYAVGSIAFFLSYHTWLRLFKRERGCDSTRVRLLKEMTPWSEAALSLIVSIVAIILIAIFDDLSQVFWLWTAMLFIQLSAFIAALCNRNRLVPYFFYRAYFPNRHFNVIYDGVSGMIFCEAWVLSFKRVPGDILNTNFEVGICLGSIAVLLYILVKINVENKVVKQFDAIIDDYIYAGTSKESTYLKILCNRMGYGVLDVCKEELEKVRNITSDCEKIRVELVELKSAIERGKYDIKLLMSYNSRLVNILKYLSNGVRQSKKLSSRMDEIVKIAPVLYQVNDINLIFDSNKKLYEKVVETQNEVGSVFDLIQKEVDKYYCKRSGSLCDDLTCDHRNDSMDKKYANRLSRHRFLMKLHLKNEE